MIEKGSMTAYEIAELTGKTHKSILRKARLNGIKGYYHKTRAKNRLYFNPENVKRIMELRSSNNYMTIELMAKYLECDKLKVTQLIDELKLTPTILGDVVCYTCEQYRQMKNKIKPPAIKKVKQDVGYPSNLFSLYDISTKLNKSVQLIRHHLKDNCSKEIVFYKRYKFFHPSDVLLILPKFRKIDKERLVALTKELEDAILLLDKADIIKVKEQKVSKKPLNVLERKCEYLGITVGEYFILKDAGELIPLMRRKGLLE